MSRGRRLEFFFDCSSPWTYLAFHRIQDVITETEARVSWKPILVGGVFNAVNRGLYENRAKMTESLVADDASGAGRKARYYVKDLADWAKLCGLRIGQPKVFPVNSVRAMRACLVADERDCLVPFARAVFEHYWGELEDISQPETVGRIAAEVGLDPGEVLAKVEDPAYKERLRANTQAVIDRGGFGSPTMFVEDRDMYFGNDRLDLVRAALTRP